MIQDFIDAYLAATWQNPFNNRERILGQEAGIVLQLWNGSLNLSSIRSLERGKGHGSRALDWLVRLADEHGVALYGTIQPIGRRPRLNARELRGWYARHGFEVKGREIQRRPHGLG